MHPPALVARGSRQEMTRHVRYAQEVKKKLGLDLEHVNRVKLASTRVLQVQCAQNVPAISQR